MVRKWANGTEPAGSQFHEAQREKWGGGGGVWLSESANEPTGGKFSL